MAMTELPAAVRKEIEDLRSRFEIHSEKVLLDEVFLAARVRGVPIEIHLDLATYPGRPPRLTLDEEWSWSGLSGLGLAREIRGLECQERWNRTLGVGSLLRELEKLFAREPPKKSKLVFLKRRRLERRNERSLLARAWKWLRSVWNRILRRERAPRPGLEIRSGYEKLIEEKATRIQRYREALAKLEAQWEKRRDKISDQQESLERLARSREEAQAASTRIVEELKAAGHSPEAIKAHAGYRQALAAYTDRSVDLEEELERLREDEGEADELHQKIRQHDAQLEVLVGELEELREEARDMEAELTLTELEQELIDIRTGVARADLARQREKMLRSVRAKRAELKVTKRLAGVARESDDLEYLQRAREVSAARDLEAKLGLEAEGAPVDERLAE